MSYLSKVTKYKVTEPGLEFTQLGFILWQMTENPDN